MLCTPASVLSLVSHMSVRVLTVWVLRVSRVLPCVHALLCVSSVLSYILPFVFVFVFVFVCSKSLCNIFFSLHVLVLNIVFLFTSEKKIHVNSHKKLCMCNKTKVYKR